MVTEFHLSMDYVLHEMSYANLIMYNAIIPSYNYDGDTDGEGKDVIRADDPKNRDIVKKILFG
jgi:hypothetical protein